jgi:hypothetical protein
MLACVAPPVPRRVRLRSKGTEASRREADKMRDRLVELYYDTTSCFTCATPFKPGQLQQFLRVALNVVGPFRVEAERQRGESLQQRQLERQESRAFRLIRARNPESAGEVEPKLQLADRLLAENPDYAHRLGYEELKEEINEAVRAPMDDVDRSDQMQDSQPAYGPPNLYIHEVNFR